MQGIDDQYARKSARRSRAERQGRPLRGTMYVLAAVGLLAILGLIWYYMATSTRRRTRPLAQLGQSDHAGTTEKVHRQQGSREPAAGPACPHGGKHRRLYEGLRQLGNASFRKKALEDVQKAAELFDQLSEEVADKPLLHQQALLGAAKAHEGLGDADQARKYYRQLKEKFGDTIFGRDAAEQIQRLDAAVQSGGFKALSDELNKPAAP